MATIYHNPRCSKSREGLAILEEVTQNVEIIKYLETPLSEKEIASIIDLLNIPPLALVRQNETIWKEQYKEKKLTHKEVIQALALHPKLIERPIVIHNGKAVIGRPPENIRSLF